MMNAPHPDPLLKEMNDECTSPWPSPEGEGTPLLLQEKGQGDEVPCWRRGEMAVKVNILIPNVAGIALFCVKFRRLMRLKRIFPVVPVFLLLLFSSAVAAQPWTFVKEKEGIKIYTRKAPGKSLKFFKGVTDIHASKEKVYNLIGNVKNLDWWDKNVKEIRVLYYEKGAKSQYYLVYDSPWPVADRDLCVESIITTDPVTFVRKIRAAPLKNVIPENPKYVRIKDYWQSWTLEPFGKDMVHAELEGYVDPAGSVPDWIYNMVITETPLKIIRGIKQRLETK
jgi:hypothetical protein